MGALGVCVHGRAAGDRAGGRARERGSRRAAHSDCAHLVHGHDAGRRDERVRERGLACMWRWVRRESGVREREPARAYARAHTPRRRRGASLAASQRRHAPWSTCAITLMLRMFHFLSIRRRISSIVNCGRTGGRERRAQGLSRHRFASSAPRARRGGAPRASSCSSSAAPRGALPLGARASSQAAGRGREQQAPSLCWLPTPTTHLHHLADSSLNKPLRAVG